MASPVTKRGEEMASKTRADTDNVPQVCVRELLWGITVVHFDREAGLCMKTMLSLTTERVSLLVQS